MQERVATIQSQQLRYGAAFGIFLFLFGALLLYTTILKPLGIMAASMQKLATGNTAITIPRGVRKTRSAACGGHSATCARRSATTPAARRNEATR